MSDEDTIRSALEKARTYLSEHPEEARYTDSVVTATLKEGLRFEVRDDDGHLTETDMPTGVGGTDIAGSPGWLLRGAIASCAATFIAMAAATEGVRLSALEVTVDSESNDLGLLGLDPNVPAGPLSVRTRVAIASPNADETRLRALVGDAVARCPVSDAIARAVPTSIEVEVTG